MHDKSFYPERKERMKIRMRVWSVGIVVFAGLAGGCESLRFAPAETDKQNAYLHYKTTAAVSAGVKQENATEPLRDLSAQAVRQSEAILAYYGMPEELPATQTQEQLLSEENRAITEQAKLSGRERPDPWDVADHLLELGIAAAGVIGGVYGTRAMNALQLARQKGQALREIVRGNELFKERHPESAAALKQSQGGQSADTRKLVVELKS